jgi:hypothetical protein
MKVALSMTTESIEFLAWVTFSNPETSTPSANAFSHVIDYTPLTPCSQNQPLRLSKIVFSTHLKVSFLDLSQMY